MIERPNQYLGFLTVWRTNETLFKYKQMMSRVCSIARCSQHACGQALRVISSRDIARGNLKAWASREVFHIGYSTHLIVGVKSRGQKTLTKSFD